MKFFIPVFDWNIEVEPGECWMAKTDPSKHLTIITYVEHEVSGADGIRYFSHESNHAAMDILGILRISFDLENQEALAYLQDFILHKIITRMKLV